ncbi:MAG: glycine cleavage system protein GcvH [Chloroflexi bacterium]|nr:glycine cleavage system protein GcvH [Anaerolineae bacterium]RLC72212.1 MAG: glycine cleavage system protein GcvH [Chloroflexota bacterium]
MKIDKDCRYAETHEWVRVEGNEAVTGITDYAQDQLSDVVYVELPEVGDSFAKGEAYATVESVKTASEVYMPIGGEIIEINSELEAEPQLVNEDPFGAAWFVRFTIADPSELDDLMDADAYEKFIAAEGAKGGH